MYVTIEVGSLWQDICLLQDMHGEINTTMRGTSYPNLWPTLANYPLAIFCLHLHDKNVNIRRKILLMDQFKLFTTAIIYRMKTIKTFASSERFLSTFLKLRNQSNVPLKTEGIQLQCDCCKIPIKIIEIFEMDKVIDKRIDIVIDEILRNSICDHYKDNQQCAL